MPDSSTGAVANPAHRPAEAAPPSTAGGEAPAVALLDVLRRLLESGEEERCRALLGDLEAVELEELLISLKAEAERYWTIDPRISLRFADALVFLARRAGRPGHEALGLMARADAQRFLGRYAQSLGIFEEAAGLFRSLGDEVGWARTRIGWLLASHLLGHGKEALVVARRARQILLRHREALRAATLDLNMALVCKSLGQYEEALTLLDEAQNLYESLGPSAEEWVARVKANKASYLTQLGDFQAALRLHEEALHVFQRHGSTVSVHSQEENIADVETGMGHYTRALGRYRRARASLEAMHLDVDAAWVGLHMAQCYLALNRYQEALDLAEQAEQTFERSGTPTEVARARLHAAQALARLGDVEQAQRLLEEVTRVYTEAGFTNQLGQVVLQRAVLHLKARRHAEALQVAGDAGALFASRGQLVWRAQADLVCARAALAGGDHETAETLGRDVLVRARERELPWLAHEAHHVLGDAARAAGDLDGALRAYGRAVREIERLQRALLPELRTGFLDDKLGAYQAAIAVALRQQRPRLAFSFLERAKSRTLVDYLTNHLDVRLRSSRPGSQELLETLGRLRAEHNWFYNELYGATLPRRRERRIDPEQEERLRAAVRLREKQIAEVLERLAFDRTDGLDLPPASGAPGKPAWPDLDDGTVLLEYYLADDASAVFVVRGNRLLVTPLATRPEEIRKALRAWQINLASAADLLAAGAPLDSHGHGRHARSVLAALYRALVAPVEAHVRGSTRLVIIPYGATHSVPFHALFDGESYLLERTEVAVCPSSQVLRLCCERARRTAPTALVLGHTDGGRLAHALAEARAVSALLGGDCYLEEQATRRALAEAAPAHSVVHLAAHGEARLDNPAFAHLKLADGQLSTVDIFNLDLRGALVTLSACETGRGVVASGDELVGLSRGFLFAGATTLVQSLWQVEDSSTAYLMDCFYRALRRGRPKAAALRDAQRELLAHHPDHPYLWAPFQLVGHWGAL